MTGYVQEQEMEIEALEAILMDEFKEIHAGESGLDTSERCFQVTLSPQDDDADESATTPVQLALIFSHTTNYPDEPPLLNVKSLQGIQATDLKILREKLEQEATENLGMAMVYTLVTTAKEWLCERFCQDDSLQIKEEATAKEEYVYALDEGGHAVSFVRPWEISYLLIINMPTLHLAFAIENYVQIIVPHGEPVTVDTFLAWRERFEAELALQRAKLMPESAL